MANLQGAFDNGAYQPGSVEPASFDDLPAGNYPVIISDSEMKETKDRAGQYLNLSLTIIDGDHKGRKLFDRLNLINHNQTAVTIAKQTLEAICRAVNFTESLRDSAQLHNKPMMIRLSYSEKNRKGEDIPEGQRNDIRAYKSIPQGAVFQVPEATQQQYTPPPQQAMPTQQSALPQSPSNPPW